MINALQRTILIGSILVSAVIGQASTAHAWFKVCNITNKVLKYHHSQPDSGCAVSGNPNCAWRKRGWFTISPGACSTVYSGSAKDKWFYYYAQSTDGSLIYTGSWEWFVPSNWELGDHNFHSMCQCNACVGCTSFGHRELHTTATDFTLTLHD